MGGRKCGEGGGKEGVKKKHVSCVRRHERHGAHVPKSVLSPFHNYVEYLSPMMPIHHHIINDCENKEVALCHGEILLFTNDHGEGRFLNPRKGIGSISILSLLTATDFQTG